ncbi:hypothetical protein DFJ77DRAFT_206840 [Powellomyces hirtus]|nr:hypothetical protein DFJ77DRAFT_206840 [Powellomyces hirtus]
MSSLLRMLTPSSPMGRSRHSTIDDDDEEVDASSHTPLLGHDPTGPHTRTTPRMITADGALIIVYPCRSSPPLFSFALPAALDDIVPSPQYRAHVAELNALMLVTDDEKRRRRNAAAALGAIVTITCLGAVGWLGIAQRHYWLAFWWMVLAILFMLLQLALAAFCMANLEHAMQVSYQVGKHACLLRWEIQLSKRCAVHPVLQ